MGNNNLISMDEPMRRIGHPQNPPLPPIYQQQPPPYYQNSHQPYNDSTTPDTSVRTTCNSTNMPHGDYQNGFVPHVSIDAHNSTPPPPIPFSPVPSENVLALVPSHFQHEQGEKQEMMEETDEMSVVEHGADAYHHYDALGRAINLMNSSIKNKTDELRRFHQVNNTLRAEKIALSVQLEQAKQQESVWRSNYTKLNEQLIAAKSESQEKNKTIESFEGTVRDKDAKINELELFCELSESKLQQQSEVYQNQIDSLKTEVGENKKQVREEKWKVSDLLVSKKQLNEQVEDHKKKIVTAKEYYKSKCDEVSKLKETLKNVTKTNHNLNSKINYYVKSEKTNKTDVENLKSERNGLKLSVEVLQTTVKNKSDEISRISQELEKEKKDNKVKELDLEKKTKRIKDLKETVKDLEKEKAELPKRVDAFFSQLRESAFPETGRKRSLSSSSSSSEEEPSPKSTSSPQSAVDAEHFKPQEVVPPTFTNGNSKYPIRKSSGKKQRGDGDANSSTNGNEHQHKSIGSLQLISKKYNTGDDVEKPEVSSSSRESTSPSSGGRQDKKK